MLPMQPATAASTRDMRAIDRLNAVTIGGAQLEAVLEILAALPPYLRQRPDAQALALQAYAREADLEDCASAALHARVGALAKWTAANEPDHQPDARSVIEAAARFPLGT